jgi:RNase P subunit RPR2
MADLSKFHWAERVSRRDIQRLYQSDAQGRLDEELLEQVHFAIYARVCDMLEVRQAQTFGRVTCRQCGQLVPQPFRMGSRGKDKLLSCETCGWQVTCGEYYESYNGRSLLPGSVTDLFESYMERFEQAQTPPQKMLLIDWLIHQFHVMQGIPRMSVAKNVIQGTDEQVRELIETLAGSEASTPGLSSLDAWRATYYHPVRQFKQAHSHAQVQQVAKELGIQGRHKISEDELVTEILRLAPELKRIPEKTNPAS